MYDFQNYYDQRQAGYDPHAVGKNMLRNIRQFLKGYMKRIDATSSEGAWSPLKNKIQELYWSLSMPLDMKALVEEIDGAIEQLNQLQSDHRQQDGIKISIVRILNELRNHIVGSIQNPSEAY